MIVVAVVVSRYSLLYIVVHVVVYVVVHVVVHVVVIVVYVVVEEDGGARRSASDEPKRPHSQTRRIALHP